MYREWLRVGEDCGFELLTTGDSQSLWADPFVATTVAALSTTRPRLGITVSNPVTRHPAVVASSLVALQDLSGGRVAYGISSGDSALRNIGERPSTVDELGEFVVAVRDLCESGAATWRGHDVALRWGSAHVPIWFSPEGPRTQRLAGRLADGVVLSNALTREAIERAFTNIDVGAREVGRSHRRHRGLVDGQRRPRGDRGRGHRHRCAASWPAPRTTCSGSRSTARASPRSTGPGLEALKREYDSSHHASPETAMANAALVDKYGLTEWLARLVDDRRARRALHRAAARGRRSGRDPPAARAVRARPDRIHALVRGPHRTALRLTDGSTTRWSGQS